MPPPRLPKNLKAIPRLLLNQPRFAHQIHPGILPTLHHNPTHRTFTTTHPLRQQQPVPYNFYRTHGRAFFKTFTLAFLTYQILYWFWLTIEAEEVRDAKDAEIKALEGEVRLLDEGRGSHDLRRGRKGEEAEEVDGT